LKVIFGHQAGDNVKIDKNILGYYTTF